MIHVLHSFIIYFGSMIFEDQFLSRHKPLLIISRSSKHFMVAFIGRQDLVI